MYGVTESTSNWSKETHAPNSSTTEPLLNGKYAGDSGKINCGKIEKGLARSSHHSEGNREPAEVLGQERDVATDVL